MCSRHIPHPFGATHDHEGPEFVLPRPFRAARDQHGAPIRAAPIRSRLPVTTGNRNSAAFIRLSSLVTVAPACSDFRGHGPVGTDEAPCGGTDAAWAVVTGPPERIASALFSGSVVTTQPKRMGPRRGVPGAAPVLVMDMLERIAGALFSGSVVMDRPERMGRAAGACVHGISLIRLGPPVTTKGRISALPIRLDASVTSTVPRPARPRSVWPLP